MRSPTGNTSNPYKTYQVVKLANGECWMNENLALDLTGKTLTSADSNVLTTWNNAPGPMTGGYSSSSNAPRWWDGKTLKEDVQNYDTYSANYGYYYNHYAATANNQNSQDICPKGWRLPAYHEYTVLGADASWNSTTKSYVVSYTPASGDTLSKSYTISLPAAGKFYDAWLYDAGVQGYYMPSSLVQDNIASSFQFNSGDGGSLFSTLGRNIGASMRCLAKKAGETIY